MNPQIKSSCRVAALMIGFLGLSAALSLALGSGAENVWVTGGNGNQHQAAVTSRVNIAGPRRRELTCAGSFAWRLSHDVSAPTGFYLRGGRGEHG